MKNKSSYNNRSEKKSLQLSIEELKKLIERQKRINFRELVEWNGGVTHPWHDESSYQLLRRPEFRIRRKRKRRGRKNI